VPGIFAAVYSSPLFPGAAAVSKAKRFIVEQFGCSLSNLAAVAECPTLNALLVRLGSRSRRVHLRACQALHVLRRIMQRFRKQQEAVAAAALHQRSGSTAPILNVDDDIENYTDDVPPDLARLGIEIDGPDDGDDGDDTNVAAAGVDDNVDEENAIDLSPVESELLASFLQLHFLSFMDFVAQRIAAPPATASAALSPAVDVGEQVEVLRSVQKLLPLLRDHINALSPKILTTLNLAMKQEPLRARACALWHTFIRCSSAAQLGHNLSRIFVDLLPHVEPIKGQVNEAVVSIMRALVIDRRRANALREHFRNIPVLADAVPADIRAAIAAASNSVDCATRLRQLADGVMHESADVRSCSLEALARLLREQQAYIQSKLVLPSPVPDASVLTVVRALLRRCRDASAQQRPQFAECLGLLGAIDPARIGDISLYESDTRDLDRAELAIELVNQFLVGELCAARNRVTQDRVSFAIQELMRVLDCSGVSIDALESVAAASTQLNKSEQSVLAMWNRLNESARAVVRPYLTSNYELLDGVEKPAVELPIYRPGRDRFWLLFWCQHLLSKVSGPTAAVFAACRGVLKDSTAVASFLLPHMVLNALQHGGDEIVHEISAELLAVLNTTASLYTPLRTPSQRGGFHAPPQQMLQQQLQQLAANASGFVAPHGGQMNVQRVFALYDWLSQWCAQTMAGRKRAAAHGPRTSQPRASEVNVVKLLELMPHRLLARGAAIARAWPRALRHIETHIREQWDEREQAEIEQQLDAGGGARGTPSRGGGAPLRASSRVVALQSKEELDEDIAFMYKIYSELDEPDGLAGVATLRPQVERELAADFVNAGRWQEALATYDAMLQLQSRSVTNRRGLLDTLSVTNLYYNLMTHAQAELPSLSCDDPSAPVLLSLGIEAAWRTSSWSLLERFLSHAALATDALQQPSSALMAPPPQAAPDDSTSTIGAGDKRRNDGTNAAAAAAAAANAVSTSVNFNVAIGRLLMALKSRQRERFDAVLRLTRIDEMRALSVASMESYERAYPHLVRLHMLTEVEQTWSVAPHAANELARVAPLESWSRRLQLTRPQFQTRQSLLWLRKALFELHSLDTQAQRSCLAIARAARHAGHHLVAQGALTHLSLGATASGDGAMAQRVAMERAMLLWSQGSHHAAVTTLRTLLVSMNDVSNRRLAAAALGSGGGPGDASHQQQQVVDLCLADDDDGRLGLGTARPLNDSEAGGGDVGDDRVQRAETLLLLGEWMEKTGEGEHRDIMQKYEDALSIAGDYERSHFRAASYWNTLVIATETRDLHLSLQSDSPVPEDRKAILSRLLSYVDSAIYHFGKSLQCGSAHVHESLSRLLTLWLDKYGYFMCHAAETRKGMHPSTDQKMLRAIESKVCDFLDKLPSYYFYECRAQIISRLRHQCDTIAKQLATIVTRMLQRYPDRTIWALISALNSSDKARQTIAEETVAAAVHKSGSRVENVVRQTRQLVAQLIALCDHTLADDVREMNLRTGQFSFGASLMRATRDGAQIVLPNLSALTVQLPADHAFREDGDAEVQPFDAAAPRCVEMLEHVVVFNSLQKPRRVVVRASDGVHYKFLGKKDDDLRKDARVIEFELLIGRLLSADAEARRRGLGVRTYSVVPLSETTGILEWVNNTVPVRGVLVDLYQERRQWHSKVSVRLYEQGRTVPTRVAAFEKLLKSHPPVLHRWFVNQFADASVWLRARLRYSRSLAVMSMVGFVLGLGDRHLENILIDDASGEVVFIDLNCIFLKAETFHYPEHVPFRLSQNLRDGMGVTKEEGVFRSVATITLRVLRNHRAMLMTVLETLIYDPLVDWKRHKQSAGDKAPQTEKRPASEEAEKDLHTVELKLLGQPHPSKVGMKKSSSALWPPIVKSTAGHGLAMTVEAQVDHLIREATDPRNLSHMFSGWASWL
jgi:serine/threonine-protein kinase ATR